MNRRDFIKLAGASLLGLISPRLVEERCNMLTGSILEKLARGQQLSETEIQELKRWGDETDLNNAFTKGLQTGSSSVNASDVSVSGVIKTGKDVVSGLAVRLRRTSTQTCPSGATSIQWEVEDYDDGNFFNLSVSATNITIPVSGIYNVTIGGIITANAAAASNVYVITTVKSGLPFFPGMQFYLSASQSYRSSASDEREYTAGEVMTVDVSQTTGTNATLRSGYFTMRLIRQT